MKTEDLIRSYMKEHHAAVIKTKHVETEVRPKPVKPVTRKAV